MLTYITNADFYMFSPLDQFGDDDSSVGLVDNMLTDLLPNTQYSEKFMNFTKVLDDLSILKISASRD